VTLNPLKWFRNTKPTETAVLAAYHEAAFWAEVDNNHACILIDQTELTKTPNGWEY
jgi:hypothetical protein